METKVLTQEEIDQLRNLQQQRKDLTEQFGLLEINYESQKQSLIYQLNQLLKSEEEEGDKLQKKYGSGTIDLSKGEFTSN
jgi:hypothetical protein